jgi:uncharacterized protein (TIGR03000 family)
LSRYPGTLETDLLFGPGYAPVIAQPQSRIPARIKVELPQSDAAVTFDGLPTTTAGSVREFETAPLEEGRYTYEIQATWMQNGHLTTKTQKVFVTPGAQTVVIFLPG